MFKRIQALLLPLAIFAAAVLGGASSATATLAQTRVGGYRPVVTASRLAASPQVPESQQASAVGWPKTVSECCVAAESEVVQRAMSKAELAATESSGLVRGGRSGTHYVSDAVNSDALRARQRMALPQTPEVKVTMEVPAGTFGPATKVAPKYNMPGGGMERTASGPVPARVIKVEEY